MNKLIRLSPTGIEYGDYAWNFASGCGNNVDGRCKGGGFKCWAYPITQRFAERYPNGFNPTIYPEALLSPLYLKKPSRILCAFMGDLFCDCPEFDPDRIIEVKMPSGFIDHDTLKGWIFNAINYCPQHTFLFLTKQPQNLAQFSPFPDNCWIGSTVCTQAMFDRTMDYMVMVEGVKRYLSIEPLLTEIKATQGMGKSLSQQLEFLDWVIIGGQSGKDKFYPQEEWIQEIESACDNARIPIFEKGNLRKVWYNYPRQEMPMEGDYANSRRPQKR